MKVVGARIPRYDGIAHVTGRTTYVDDVRVPGTLWVKALRSPHHSARILKLDARLNLDQPDGQVWLTENARRALVRVLRQYKPRVLMTTHWEDPHPDHAHTSMITRQAARLASMVKYDAESGQNAVPVPAIMHSLFSRRVVPSFIVDVSGFVEDKMLAIKAHVSQFYRPDSEEPVTRISDPGFLDQIDFRMRYFGSLIGVAAGEPFYISEALNVEDPFALLTRPMNIYS